MSVKTNAVRQLDQAKIPYDLAAYEVDESDLSAETVAAKIGWEPGKVYKTLAARGDKTGVMLAIIATPQALDLKALASASGNKKVELLPLTFEPRPKAVVRVLVGRLEYITAAAELRVEAALLCGDEAALSHLDRFLEPHLRNTAAHGSSERVRALARQRLAALSR